MSNYQAIANIQVAKCLKDFIEQEVMPNLEINTNDFWHGVADIINQFTPKNRALLTERDSLQLQIDHFFETKRFPSVAEQAEFLTDIGYIEPEVADFEIETTNVDSEIAQLAGPQLVVPIMNARFALNAVNARWGSFYDALYGTDVIDEGDGAERVGQYNPVRGQKVIAFAKNWLDETLPLENASHFDVTGFRIEQHQLVFITKNGETGLTKPNLFKGFQGDAQNPNALLFEHHGLHIIIEINPNHAIGKQDQAHISDIKLESALTTIMDCEDSVAAVDAEDKVVAYRNWLGLNQQTLSCEFNKNGASIARRMNPDLCFTMPNGKTLQLKGRSLMFVRNVGHLMQNPAVLDNQGEAVFEGILDAIFTSLIALHDLKNTAKAPSTNSSAGSIYIVKPKMHGSKEVAFSNALFAAVEQLLNLPKFTIKMGIMDEERRTSLNLKNCIHAAKNRVVFINTGFLDRTGDEIHTAMKAGAMVRKNDIKQCQWLDAYEKNNVTIGLACGLSGKAQIGKGMWPIPDKMKDMLDTKINHPLAGANTAWVPSPTAATLHSLHYHKINVFAQQQILKKQNINKLTMLNMPLAENPAWSENEVIAELDNNIQGILGYVVRWIDQGVGCSKVPDINNIGLMEDRATLRISSQHIANWLYHGICSEQQVRERLTKMAEIVDQQNANDANYQPMVNNLENNIAFKAASALIFQGTSQPNGYTEPLLHQFRAQRKSQ